MHIINMPYILHFVVPHVVNVYVSDGCSCKGAVFAFDVHATGMRYDASRSPASTVGWDRTDWPLCVLTRAKRERPAGRRLQVRFYLESVGVYTDALYSVSDRA